MLTDPRGRIVGEDAGFLKLLFRREDCGWSEPTSLASRQPRWSIALMALLTDSGADLFNRVCFNYPTVGDLYKYAAYDAILQRASAGLSATHG